jgi:recombinational DNA repair ATPase RecF
VWPARLEADRLRNLEAVGVDLPPGLVLIAGRKGQGKTRGRSTGTSVVVYQPSPAELRERQASDFLTTYREALARTRQRDRQLGRTCRGPHRDDLLIELNGVDLRRFGSAGQVRGTMIALKLGKLSLLQKGKGEVPVFLMDDFDSDLDEVRAAALADHLRRGGFQALVATSKEGMAERIGVPFTKILLSEGRVREA